MKKSLRNIPYYILLFPAFTVLILAVNNLGQIHINVIWRPLLYSLVPSIVLFVLGWIFLQDIRRAGLLSIIFSLFALTYGHFYAVMEDRVIGSWTIGTHSYMLSLWGLLFLGLTYLVVFRLKENREFTLILNVVTLIMVLIQVGRITTYEVRAQILDKQTGSRQETTFLQPDPSKPLPDVYFIILDKYARSDALDAFYKYDNSDFIQGLESLGFWVPECSRSNYAFTVMSLSSELNMAYVEDLTDEPSLKTTTALIRNNRVHKAFEEIGYTTIAFDMGFSWGNLKGSDYYFDEYPDNIDTWSFDPFEILYIRSTLGLLLFDGDIELGRHVTMTDLEEKAARTRLILEVLPQIPEMKGPKFVHAHIVTPHPPYVFNADGSLNPDAETVNPADGYKAQLAYIEPRILSVAEQIIEKSETPPIIIIQGDHAFGNKYVTSILLALYLPGSDLDGLNDHSTLINVFPYVFNAYYGADIDYLPDISYSHSDDWYDSVPLEEWNADCRVD